MAGLHHMSHSRADASWATVREVTTTPNVIQLQRREDGDFTT